MTLITDDELREWRALCEGGAFLYDFETAGEYYLANGRIQRLIAEVERLRVALANVYSKTLEGIEDGYDATGWEKAIEDTDNADT